MSMNGHKILEPVTVAQTVFFALHQPYHVSINELLVEPQVTPI